MKKILGFAVIAAMFMLLFAGCGGDEETPQGNITPPTKYDVTFDLNGVLATPQPPLQQIVEGSKAVRPATDPSAVGFMFVDWYDTEVKSGELASETPYDFDTPITEETTLWAGWDRDLANFYYVDFYSESHHFAERAVANNGTSKVAKPAPDPVKEGYTLLGWTTETSPTESSALYDFDAVVISNLDLYAVWQKNVELTDIVKINDGNVALNEDFFNALLRYEGTPALAIYKDMSNEYRVQFNFNPPLDRTTFGQIDLNLESDGISPENVVVSLFIEKEDPTAEPEKVMFFPGGFTGERSITIGGDLKFKPVNILALEIYAFPGENPVTYPTLYLLEAKTSGDAVPDPEIAEIIDAENIFLSLSNTATSGTMTIDMGSADGKQNKPSGATPPNPDTYYWKDVYVYFDAPGEAITSIEVKFNRETSGGNMLIKGAIDQSGDVAWGGASDYLGYFGWDNPPIYFADPQSINDSLDVSSLKALKFEIETSNSTDAAILELLSVKFYKGEASDPTVDKGWVEDAGTVIADITSLSATPVEAVKFGKLDDGTKVMLVPAEGANTFRLTLNIDPAADTTGTQALSVEFSANIEGNMSHNANVTFTFSDDSTHTMWGAMGADWGGSGFGTNWLDQNYATGVKGKSVKIIEYWTDNVTGATEFYIKAIGFIAD